MAGSSNCFAFTKLNRFRTRGEAAKNRLDGKYGRD